MTSDPHSTPESAPVPAPTGEPIVPASMPAWTRLPDLAGARLGGAVLWANDEFFAEKENLIRREPPVWKEDAYTDRGKWMDGWETRRRRTPGHDLCILRLGLAGVLRGVVVDTRYFRGNFPQSFSLEACALPAAATPDELAAPTVEWIEVLPRTELRGHAVQPFAVAVPWRFTHLRFHIYPDGGVARLRVHGEVLPDWPALLRARGDGEIDLVAVEHGGRALASSDQFYSSPENLLLPGRGVRMDDGWETRRRRGPGFDWAILRLGIAGSVRRVEVDTAHFKGNYPDRCTLEACDARAAGEGDLLALPWREILPPTNLAADQVHALPVSIDAGTVTHVRLSIHPDGGVSRLRVLGTPDAVALREAGVARLDAMTPGAADAALADCCGAPEWVRRMRERRPFTTAAELHATADLVWDDLGVAEWLLAFRAHPAIGAAAGAAGERPQGERGAGWSEEEQAGVALAAAATREALQAANRAYRERFGYVFLVCASGRSADEMLALCRERLANDAERELSIAGEEERKILHLRLDKLLLA